MLKVTGLTCSYGERIIIENSSIEIEIGKITAIVGANGIGKSTLLSAIVGLIQSKYVTYTVDGAEVSKLKVSSLIDKGIYLLSENKGIIKELTVEENLILCSSKKTYKHELITVLDKFPSLKDKLKSEAGTLSGGEKQMLGLAKVLMLKPKYLLLDEPTSGLSPIMIQEVYRVIESLRSSTAMLLVEQNPFLAKKHADSVYTIVNKEIVELPKNIELANYYL
jgi:branched-chain amino acid transport system ATP-binding protein